MRARVMISSVTKDEVPLANLERLAGIWNEVARLQQRLIGDRETATATFSAIRSEIAAHLEGKYGLDAYIFEETPGPGRSPETETILEATRAHLATWNFRDKDWLADR
jgi:lipocalin